VLRATEAKISRQSHASRKISIFLLLLVFSLFLSALVIGCQKKEEVKKPPAKNKVPKTRGHVLSKKDQKLVIRDVKNDLKILAQVRADPAPLKDALGKTALEDFTNLVNKEAAEGKVKVRRFKDMKLKLGDYSGGIAGVSFYYKDQSYYQDTKGNHLTEPTGTTRRYVLAAQKIDDRWKIVAFFSPEVKKGSKKKE